MMKMPFLAMKIDASLLNLKHRANRRPKNTQLVSKNWKVIPMMADYLSIDLSEILFSSNWKIRKFSDTEKLRSPRNEDFKLIK